jgi:glycosyltransferase involved in cell wall biosynthesis
MQRSPARRSGGDQRTGARRLALVISALDDGGAQRVFSLIANHWVERGVEVTVITLSRPESDFFRLAPAVRRVALGLTGPSRNPLQGALNNQRRWRALRRALREARPDAVISFVTETNLLTLAAGLGLGVPVVVAERSDPRHQPLGAVRRGLRRRLYPRAGAVVVQTESVARWARQALPGARVAVVPNPAARPQEDGAGGGPRAKGGSSPQAEGLRGLVLPPSGHLVVGMGRLSREKGFDHLVRAFARCAEIHPEWSLVIAGDGDERERLADLASRLGIAARVHLAGRVRHPGGLLRRADLFVLPSRHEGFPNALLEAMACGLPVIAFDCPSGPAEIVRPGQDGVLVPAGDEEGLASAMRRLMGDEEARRRLGERAVEVLERFSLDAVTAKWDAVIERAAADRGGEACA